MTGATRSATLEELKWVVETGDPQYLPAQFLYAVASLEDGRLQQAEAILISVIEPIERHNKAVIDEITADWFKQAPRHASTVRKVSRFKPWLDFWLKVARYLYGGDYYRYALNWQATKEAHQELQERAAEPTFRGFAQANFESHLNLFRHEPILVTKTEAAFKRSAVSDQEAAEAMAWLDLVLDERRFRALEHRLSMLRIYMPGETLRQLSDEQKEEHAKTIDEQIAESVLFKSDLKSLAESWRVSDWKKSRELIDEILDKIQSPNVFQAGREIEAARLPRGRLARYFFPNIVQIEKLQGRFRFPLYRESRYLRAQCWLGTRDRDLLEKAESEAEFLLDRILGEPSGHSAEGRHAIAEVRRLELRALTFCLRVEAAVHLELGETADDKDYRAVMAGAFLVFADEHAKQLDAYTTSKPPEIVAAAYRAWALLERRKAHGRSEDWRRAGLPAPPSREQEFLRKSLDARASAATWICLAESQLKSAVEDARRSLEQALKLSPEHPYATRLLASLPSGTASQ